MVSSCRIPAIAMLYIFTGERVDKESNKKLKQKGGRAVKKVIFLTQILLCIFLQRNLSVVVSHEALIILE